MNSETFKKQFFALIFTICCILILSLSVSAVLYKTETDNAEPVSAIIITFISALMGSIYCKRKIQSPYAMLINIAAVLIIIITAGIITAAKSETFAFSTPAAALIGGIMPAFTKQKRKIKNKLKYKREK